jgi:hypothetical protein
MLKEIFTLESEGGLIQYYILFTRDRNIFEFQPTYKNKSAAVFRILVQNGELITEDNVPSSVLEGAREKVREIISNDVFDRI